MRYTGSVNKFCWYALIPSVLVGYFFFRLWIFVGFDDGNRARIAQQHRDNLAGLNAIDGVILGGSNAYFSLEAERIGAALGQRWYNLSLMNQGYSDSNYWGFVASAIDSRKRELVEKVVYSSLSPNRPDAIDKRAKSDFGIEGDRALSLIGARSLGSYLDDFISGRKESIKRFPLPRKYGDFPFDDFHCSLKKGRIKFEINDNSEQVSAWVFSELKELAMHFPNADIFLVIPSEYYGSKLNEDLADNMARVIEESVERFSASHGNLVEFVRQSPYPSLDMVCDARHHADEKGRIWRTENLLEYLALH